MSTLLFNQSEARAVTVSIEEEVFVAHLEDGRAIRRSLCLVAALKQHDRRAAAGL